MATDNVIDFLTKYAINERLSQVIQDDKELDIARIHAHGIYEKMRGLLSEEQQDLLEQLTLADVERNARIEFLTYQQGLKDMYNLMMSLQNEQNNDTGK